MYWASRRITERRRLRFTEEATTIAAAALQVAAAKVSGLADSYPGYFPLYTD